MSKLWFPSRKERVETRIFNLIERKKSEVLSRPYSEPHELTAGDLFMAHAKGNYIYCVEKVTKKTITVSEGRSGIQSANYGEFTYGHNPKRVRHSNFIVDYLPIKVSQSDIDRSMVLKKRMSFIRDFCRKQGHGVL